MSNLGKAYIPRSVDLPQWGRIIVRQLKPMQMKAKHKEFYDGIWDVEKMTIDLNKSLDHQRKWYVFSHEFAHAVNDWMLWLVNKEIAKG